MKTSHRLITASLLSLLSLILFSGAAEAVSQSPNGITVSPAFQEVSIPKDAQQQPVSFTITNNGTEPQKLSLSVSDFNALNESGGLFFVGTKPTELQKKYGLAKWVSLPTPDITIQSGKSTTVEAAILNLPELQAGGHYGALMVSINSTDSSSSLNKVGLHPIASSLLFVTKVGGDTHRLSLSSVTHNGNLISLPTNVNLRLKNNGNTHVVPRGTVRLVNSKGETISKGVINESSKIILPETTRDYSVTLNKLPTTIGIGKYSLVVDFRFDGIDQYRSYQQSFSYIPLVWFVVGLAIVVGVIAFIYSRFTKRRKG